MQTTIDPALATKRASPPAAFAAISPQQSGESAASRKLALLKQTLQTDRIANQLRTDGVAFAFRKEWRDYDPLHTRVGEEFQAEIPTLLSGQSHPSPSHAELMLLAAEQKARERASLPVLHQLDVGSRLPPLINYGRPPDWL